MNERKKKKKQGQVRSHLKTENKKLKAELEEARETLRAIQSGEVDALVVSGKEGAQIYTLQNADRPYRILVETMNQGAATLSQDGTLFYCNRHFAEMLRFSLEFLIGSSIYNLIDPKDRFEFQELFEQGRNDKSKKEFQLKTSQGIFIPVLLSMSAVDLEGCRGVCLVATELTEQKRLEQSRAEVDKLHLEKDLRENFVATLSHDLRNPLSAAISNAQMIVRYPDQIEKQAERASRIINNIERADKMIQDLLDANQIRAGEKLPLKIRPCDLHVTALETLEDLSMIHGGRFILKSEGSLQGYWSCNQLRRVIENLATNAIKYGDPTSPVEVRLKKMGESCQLEVHNEGCGLTLEEQTHLFKPFVRTLGAMNSGQKGWGLGLTLVRGVVEAHGGEVHIESSPYKGTTFIVTLPSDSRSFQ